MSSQNTTKIRPLGDRVIVLPKKSESKTAGGIVIPDTSDKEKPVEGTVRAVGPGKQCDGKLVQPQVKTGDKVIFGKYAGTSIKLNSDEEELLILREEDIMGVVE